MSYVKIHAFEQGKAYSYKRAEFNAEYLDAVIGAEKFVSAFAKKAEEGTYWQTNGASALDMTFYSGDAGILYFYLKLYEALGDEKYKAEAEDGANYLAATWREYLTKEPTVPLPGAFEGLHFGLAGIGLVLGEAARTLGKENAKKAAAEIVDYYAEKAVEDEEGLRWSGFTGLAMDGGIILFLLQQAEYLANEKASQLAQAAGKWFLTKGVASEEGGLVFNGFKGIAPINLPNFEFGSAGSGYLLTKLYELTRDKAYLEAAVSAADYLDTIKEKVGKGYLIPYTLYEDPSVPHMYYLSSCHGPAGTSKLYYKLYQYTGEQKYLDRIEELVDGFEAMGAPEKMSEGLWNNVTFCCGHAGMVQFFAGLYLATKNDRYLDLAERAAAVILGEQESKQDGSIYWPTAWERINPTKITDAIGYFDGAAGIAAVLLQLYLLKENKFKWNRLIDDPFPVEE